MKKVKKNGCALAESLVIRKEILAHVAMVDHEGVNLGNEGRRALVLETSYPRVSYVKLLVT